MELNIFNIYHCGKNFITASCNGNNTGDLFEEELFDLDQIILTGNKYGIKLIMIYPSEKTNQKFIHIHFKKNDEGIAEYTNTIKFYLEKIVHHAPIIINNKSYSIVDIGDIGSFQKGKNSSEFYIPKDYTDEWNTNPHGIADIQTCIGLCIIVKSNQ